MNRVLIIEDEDRIASFVEKGLKANGFVMSVAEDAKEGLAMVRMGDFDLVILDLGLPDRDGMEVLREFREADAGTPVIILTARDSVADTVSGLESGADDYVPKPFRFEELLARVRVRLREQRAPEATVLHAGDTALDLRTRRVSTGDRSIELTAREFALAETFFRRRVRRVLAQEARRSADRHRPGDGLPAGAGICEPLRTFLSSVSMVPSGACLARLMLNVTFELARGIGRGGPVPA